MTTATDIVNQAIQLIGNNQPPVTGNAPNFDTSPAGKAAKILYVPCVQTVGRRFGWDFARNLVALQLSGNPATILWPYEYKYPSNGVQVWQLVPSVLADPNNPLPVNWSVGNAEVAGVQTKVIWTDLQNAMANYNNSPNENTWDALFREAVVRQLASELAMALAGKPETAQQGLESGNAFATLGEGRDS
ncbi:hypothetical protein SAMN05216337_1017141 [Bradyrhizobium brasilense]|uniref:Uncharacterized protein n=1 Tax=Bradyrhizobium brasilense TaxID=1419277 RepID=A0A1G6YY19_9BRAD|nr:hypothetical protein [Bradyrhizobium brasilense]SDD95299.1 hypothetical protein SAMN05216337_1017141 [Bradyrhizobium brasilense]